MTAQESTAAAQERAEAWWREREEALQVQQEIARLRAAKLPNRAPEPSVKDDPAEWRAFFRDVHGRAVEMYRPCSPWRNQDRTPQPVPELDADGHPWQVTEDGRHVGTHNGEQYCLEWLPVPDPPRPDFGPGEGRDPAYGAPADLPSGPFAVEQAILDRWQRGGAPAKPTPDPEADPWAWPPSTQAEADSPWLQEVGERYQLNGEIPSGWTAEGDPVYQEPEADPWAWPLSAQAEAEPEAGR